MKLQVVSPFETCQLLLDPPGVQPGYQLLVAFGDFLDVKPYDFCTLVLSHSALWAWMRIVRCGDVMLPALSMIVNAHWLVGMLRQENVEGREM